MLSGFGIEELGKIALRRPVAALVLLAMLSLLSAVGLTRLGFSGANVDILRDGSVEIADYDHLLSRFRNFNNDAVLLVRSDDLASAEGIENLRDLHFELQFEETVESVLSIFSLVRYEPDKGGWGSAVPAEFEADDEVGEALARLASEIPNSRSLIDPSSGSAVIVVYVKPGSVLDSEVRETVARLQAIASSFDREGFSVTVSGQPAIRSAMIGSIFSDLVRLLPLALVLCGAIAWFLLGSVPAVLATVAAPAVSVLWMLGFTALAGIDLDFLTNILPVLLVVVVFSDSLHLYIRWEELLREGATPREAAERAVATVGPASVVSSLTTAVALFSLVLSGNEGLERLGIVGGLAVLGGLVAILTVQPLIFLGMPRAGFRPAGKGVRRLDRYVGASVSAVRRPLPVIAAGLVLLAAGLYAHFDISSRFRLVDYLAQGSTVAESEGFLDRNYPGSTPLFVILKLDPDKPLLDPGNIVRFDETLTAIGQVFPRNAFYSLQEFIDELRAVGKELDEADLDALPDYLTSRFISQDRREVLVTIFASANLSADEMAAKLSDLRAALDRTPAGANTIITGYPVLSAVVAPRLMDNLRMSLIASILVAIGIIALATRSWRIGLACLVPNILPIVGVELALWLAGIPLNLSVTVALTVAFGLAVNDSIHLSNDYLRQRRHAEPAEAMALALKHVFPAMVATTIILTGGLLIMMFSMLPAVALFSIVMILTLVLALAFDLFQLPAYVVLLAEKHRIERSPQGSSQG